MGGSKLVPDLGSTRGREGTREIQQFTTWQGAESRIDVVEPRICKFQRDHLGRKGIFDRISSGVVRAGAVSHPEEVSCAVPDAVASSLLHEAFRQSSDDLDKTARMKASERGLKVRLFSLTLGVAKVRQQHLPVEDNGGIGRKHQIGETVNG